MKMGTIDEKLKVGYSRVGYLVAAACIGLEVGAVCSQEELWEKGSLKHPTETYCNPVWLIRMHLP